MFELKNELSWSITKYKLFKSCRRAYYYTYYLAWDGWKASALPEKRQAYLLKNMTNLDMWAGQIVHDVINDAFRHCQKNGQWPTEDQTIEKAREYLRIGWQQSTSRAWENAVKGNINLFEHYYNIPISSERTDSLKRRINKSLSNFIASEKLAGVRNCDPATWEIPSTIPFVNWDGIKIWTNLDFAVFTPEKYTIYDWKTGKQSEEDSLQLSCYALFALENNYKLEDISASLVYLQPEVEITSMQFSQEEIDKTREYIKSSFNEMKSILDDPVNNVAGIANFPQTDRLYACRQCSFREFCADHIKIE